MKISITGVAGFIGSNLCAALLEKGYSVVGIDNMSQGCKKNLEDFRIHPNFEFHEIDVRDDASVLDVTKGCEVIVHLAAFKIPRYSDALDTLLINSHGAESVAKAAVSHGAKVVAASTSDVYGKNRELPFDETSDLVMGSPDVRAKVALLFALQARGGVKTEHGLEGVKDVEAQKNFKAIVKGEYLFE